MTTNIGSTVVDAHEYVTTTAGPEESRLTEQDLREFADAMPKQDREREAEARDGETIAGIVSDIMEQEFPDCDLVPTCGGHAHQRHPRNMVGRLWRVNDPETVMTFRFWRGRIKPGDLWLCIRHSGDCVQDYIAIEQDRYGSEPNQVRWIGRPHYLMSAYGIGDAAPIDISEEEYRQLMKGEAIIARLQEAA